MDKQINDVTQRIKEKFIICYDKFTKPMALSLRNKITESRCVLWGQKDYNANESKLTNRNSLLLLNKEMIEEHFANPAIKPIKFTEGVIIKKEGNTIGIMIDPEADISKIDIKEIKSKTSWWKYVLGIVVPILTIGGIPVSIVTTILMYKNDKKKRTEFKLLFDAVQKLDEETIERYLRNEPLI